MTPPENGLGDWYGRLYDDLAPTYDFDDRAYPFYENEQRAVDRLLARHVPPVPAGEVRQALDLGCGPGHDARWLLERGYHVLGIDVSERMVAAARASANGYGDRARFLKGDLTSVELPAGSVHLVTMFGSVLNHLADWSEIFARVGDALVDGGLLLFDVDSAFSLHQVLYVAYGQALRRPGCPGPRDLVGRALATLQGRPHRALFPIETATGLTHCPFHFVPGRLLRRLLASAGLEVVAWHGANGLASLLPRTALSVTYRDTGRERPSGRLTHWLNAADDCLTGRWAWLAGLQLVAARKPLAVPAAALAEPMALGGA